jgi:hypothetical protein
MRNGTIGPAAFLSLETEAYRRGAITALFDSGTPRSLSGMASINFSKTLEEFADKIEKTHTMTE